MLMLNVKSNYSLLSSMLKPSDIIEYALKNNQKFAAICDNNMYITMYFYQKCLEKNIKPIIGLEIRSENIHLALFIKDYEGYKSLIKLSTIQNEREVTREDLKAYNKNLLCVVNYSNKDCFNEYLDYYEDVYLGYSNKEEESLAKTITSNIVFFKEALYLNKSDASILPYLYLIRDGKTITDNIIYNKENHELDISNEFELISKNSLKNLEEIIAKCNLVFQEAELLLPIYHPNNNMDPINYLFELTKVGLKKRIGEDIPEKYKNRLSYELKIITEMGFCNYFLVVYDFIKFAKKNNILVGPGRGSAAGSLVAYTLGITEIDPIKYELLFERFLNPERKTMPDIDTDFPDDKREIVINYVKEKYGEKHVAGIVTFGTLGAKQVLRDVGRILNIPIYKIDNLTKLIPIMSKDKLETIYKQNQNFKMLIDNDTALKSLFKIAQKFEGFPRHTSSHAAGIVMCEKPLDEVLPLTISDNLYLTSYSMEYLETLGLLKMDFLGLRNLSIIANIINDIEQNYQTKINFNDIPLDDPAVLNLFTTAETTGIFQFESTGMRNFLKRLQPNTFEDIFAAIALFRPGPAINIDSYIKRRHKQESVIYLDPSLKPILENTYGIFIYQEQIMQIANIYAGYSLGEADILRRAMSKKKIDLLKQEEEKFLKKSIEKGHNPETSKKIFDLILNFASYGFNRSHSVAYSLIAYKLAYFKVHYKEIFYCNLLSNVINATSKTYEYILEIKSQNIKIEKPDINISTSRYLVKDNIIYLPFSIVNSIGTVASKQILEARREKFIDIFDCFSRLIIAGVTRKNIESLIYIDAFRSFGYNIKTLIENLDNLINYATLTKDLDPSLVMQPIILKKEEYNQEILLEEEKELIGFYLTHHPTTKYLKENRDIVPLIELNKYQNKKIKTLVFIDKIKTIKTKKGEDMAFLTGSDEQTNTQYILFPKVYNLYNYLERSNIIKVEGKVEKRLNELQIIVDKITLLNGVNYE